MSGLLTSVERAAAGFLRKDIAGVVVAPTRIMFLNELNSV